MYDTPPAIKFTAATINKRRYLGLFSGFRFKISNRAAESNCHDCLSSIAPTGSAAISTFASGAFEKP